MLFIFICCIGSETKEEISPNTRMISGKVDVICEGVMMIDILEIAAGVDEPYKYTQVDEDMKFSFEVQSQLNFKVHGFCYKSIEDLDNGIFAWKSEAIQILSTESGTDIVLSKSFTAVQDNCI